MISEKHSKAARENIIKSNALRKARRIEKPCVYCGRIMRLAASMTARRFCSWACRKVAMVGEYAPNFGKGDRIRGSLNPNYKSGVSATRRNSGTDKRFRRHVLSRDGFRCVVCGSWEKLHAHHIDDFASFPLLHGDSSNGVTLCLDCHKKAHSKTGGYGFITKEGRMVLKFRKRNIPGNGSMRHTAIGTFILGWK